MQTAPDAAHDGIEILPVVVVTRSFPARPSAIPDVRSFVRRQLAQTTLPADSVGSLDQRIADVLLEAAGRGRMIQVLLRIFGDRAEVDVLQTDEAEMVGALALPPDDGENRSDRPSPATTGPAAPAPADGTVDGRPLPAGGASGQSGMPFAEWLADAIRREGMTMEAAAHRMKVSVKTISRWVRGATEPRLGDLTRMREVFGELPFP
jgi:hypothetical protein